MVESSNAAQQSHPPRFPFSPRTKHNAPRFLFFPRFLPPEKIFSYRSIRIIPAFPPLSLPLFLPPSLLKFAHEFISRSTGWRTRNPGTLVCVSAWALRFGAGSILISIQSRTISSGSTFEENERTRVPSLLFPPFNPRLQPSPSSARRLLQRCDFWIFPLWEKLCKRIESTGLERWEKVIHAKIYLIHLNQYFAVYVSIGVNKSRKDSFFFSF